MEFFSNLFAAPPTLAERIRENKKMMRKTERQTEREIARLETKEKQILLEIRRAAEQQKMELAKMKAQNLQRHRRAQQMLYKVLTQVQGTALQLELIQTNEQLQTSLKNSYRVLALMNRRCNLPQLRDLVINMEKEKEIMNMKEEIMEETTDTLFDEDGDEQEQEQILQSVLDEIGLNVAENMQSVKKIIIIIIISKLRTTWMTTCSRGFQT